MERKTTDDLRQELMDQPSIETYLSDNRSCFMEQGILKLLESLRKCSGVVKYHKENFVELTAAPLCRIKKCAS